MPKRWKSRMVARKESKGKSSQNSGHVDALRKGIGELCTVYGM